jgi:hypothetical protein
MRWSSVLVRVDEVSQDYLVECYWADASAAGARKCGALIEAATRDVRADGRFVALLGSVLVPADEVCFWRFRSTSIAEVEEVARRSGIAFDRVTPSIDLCVPATKHRLPPTDDGSVGR